ncbi:MAG TPA: hypothetical protein VJU81_01940 [Methylomirabilota bacterium]|nr:hypothetical protein [Methylomirabilota bacterium]
MTPMEMPKWPGDGLKETEERICPSCRDRAIKPRGHVLAISGVLKSLYQCEACAQPFVFVRIPRS